MWLIFKLWPPPGLTNKNNPKENQHIERSHLENTRDLDRFFPKSLHSQITYKKGMIDNYLCMRFKSRDRNPFIIRIPPNYDVAHDVSPGSLGTSKRISTRWWHLDGDLGRGMVAFPLAFARGPAAAPPVTLPCRSLPSLIRLPWPVSAAPTLRHRRRNSAQLEIIVR